MLAWVASLPDPADEVQRDERRAQPEEADGDGGALG